MKIITINNGKGDVGKTILSINIAIDIATRGYNVALLDTDNKQNQ